MLIFTSKIYYEKDLRVKWHGERVTQFLSFSGQEFLAKVLMICKKQPPEVHYQKGVLKSFAKFTGKRLDGNLFFEKVTGLTPELY